MSAPAEGNRDVRMRGFQDRTDLLDAQGRLFARLRPLSADAVALTDAAGRILAVNVISETAIPPFDRAAMDGYALRGSETFGAGPYNPLEFEVVGEVFPGRAFANTVGPGQAVRIMTGAPIPVGADAVAQAEIAECVGGRVRITDPVPPGRHVGRRGEDVEPGAVVLPAGRRLRPQDAALLAAVGASPVAVIRRPRVAILVTGDELLPCGSRPQGHRIVDSNSVMLAALVRRDGGEPAAPRLLQDRPEVVKDALLETDAEVVLISGGSSVGQEDHAPRVLREVGELTVHGLALRPASPAGFGFLPGDRPVFLLPGNPVSCLCAYDLLAGLAVRVLGGGRPELPYRRERLPLARKIASAVGRVDYVRVEVRDGAVEPLATSGASVLSSTTRAAGFVLVPRDSEGHAASDTVEVYFYDP